MNAMLASATAAVQAMTPEDLIKYLDSPDDIHAQAVKSAKKIAQDFVERAADLAAAMKLILQFDQVVLKKLNASTVYDFGKPKTDEVVLRTPIFCCCLMTQLRGVQPIIEFP
ncbi:unnamed protein product [Dibothriocephalus latus]|uniref:DUF5740 domain-containing protein n=1 Tax=Dibothriocephalus latus TaxID=60516 RepID=A0A3P7R2E2_DIBLA|nr:unnamed protein product [Dibothriocephalus latus]